MGNEEEHPPYWTVAGGVQRPNLEGLDVHQEAAMAGKQRLREGYGSTSEQRQRNLEGDAFEERAPHTSEESEAARGSVNNGGQVMHVDTLAGRPGRGEPEEE